MIASYIITKAIVRGDKTRSYNMSIIDEIKNRCNIVDVIGSNITLKKAGSNHKGLCPFHSEKTPSFVVSEDKQIFTCFGCGATGDVIEFTKRYYNLDFQSAIEKLSEDCGIEFKNIGYKTESKKLKLYEITREAATFFYRQFFTKPNSAEKYMKNRGFKPEILQKFGIGYADAEWQSLYDHLISKGYDEDVLITLGLVAKSSGRTYDKFRNRIMFPIINTRGKVIGFGGRSIDESLPKYLNSNESSIFHKKNNLFGLYLTRQDINREDCAILVEGYMDVISLYQNGIKNVAASLGTALTESQARTLKRYTDNVILAYDPDESGQAAALRGMDILYDAGCKVKVLQIPDNKDPDEYVKEKGNIEFNNLLKQAIPFIEYKFMKIREDLDIDTAEGSVSFLKQAAVALRRLSPIEAETYIKKIAAETGISEGALRHEVLGGRGPAFKNSKTKVTLKRKKTENSCTMLEQNLIRLMLIKSSYVPLIEEYKDSFETVACFSIYEIIRSLYRSDEEIDLHKLKDSLNEGELDVLENILDSVHFADRDKEVFEECVSHIMMNRILKKEEELIKILSILDDEKDGDKIIELSKVLMDIQKEKYRGTNNEL